MDSDDPFKPYPTTRVNPTLPRDVLGLIFARYHEEVERVRAAPIPTRNGPIPSHIIRDALQTRICINACSEPGCDHYDVELLGQNGHDCGYCDVESTIYFCGNCNKLVCYTHAYELESGEDRWGNVHCRSCVVMLGCAECYDEGSGKHYACEGYLKALECLIPIGRNHHVQKYTCTDDGKLIDNVI